MINVKRERYKNQILFNKIGEDGQDILLNSKIDKNIHFPSVKKIHFLQV